MSKHFWDVTAIKFKLSLYFTWNVKNDHCKLMTCFLCSPRWCVQGYRVILNCLHLFSPLCSVLIFLLKFLPLGYLKISFLECDFFDFSAFFQFFSLCCFFCSFFITSFSSVSDYWCLVMQLQQILMVWIHKHAAQWAFTMFLLRIRNIMETWTNLTL